MLTQFGNLKFEISETSALLFQKLKITAECETEDQTNDEMKYAAYKNGKAAQITLTAILNSGLGTDVKACVREIMGLAQKGTAAYFYAGGEKLAACQFTLTKAATEEILVGASGTWLSANVNLTLTQCTKEKFNGAEASTPSGGSFDGSGWGSGTNWGGATTPSQTPAADTPSNTPSDDPSTAERISAAVEAAEAAKKASTVAGSVSAGQLAGIIKKKK